MSESLGNLIAFWEYDKYPYCLGGNVTKITDNGDVEIEQYGKGRYFCPIKILPENKGIEVLKILSSLKDEYDEEKEQLKDKFISKLKVSVPFLKDIFS